MYRTLAFISLLTVFAGTSCADLPPSTHLLGDSMLTDYKIHYAFGTYSFYRPNAITSDSLFLYISDTKDGTIAVFDAALNHQRTIGTKGRGPLEFEEIADVQAFDGSLYVLDGGNDRISRISPSGDSFLSIRHPMGSSGSLSVSSSLSLLVSSISPETEARVQEYSLDLDPLCSFFPIADLKQRIIMSPGPSVSFECDEKMIFMTSHMPRIATSIDNIVTQYDYADAFCSMYPFFDNFLSLNEKLNKEGGGYVGLFCFGKGVLLDTIFIMPGPLYSLVILDTRSLEIATINTGEISKELSRWGYGSFSDVEIFGNSVFLPASNASVVVVVGLDEVKHAIKNSNWHSPYFSDMEVIPNVQIP